MLTSDWNIVLSLPNGLTPGGMTTWAVRTAGALASSGRRVVIVAHEPPADATGFDVAALALPANVGVQWQPSLADDANWECNLAAYAALLPAVVIPTTIEQSFEIAAALALSLPSRVRVVGWNHSDHEYDYSCLTHIEAVCERFVVNTSTCAARLAERLPHRVGQIVNVPHVVDSKLPERAVPGEGAPLRIGYAGRLEESAKRVGDLVTIAEHLRDAGIAFSMRIMGDGPMRSKLTARIERFNGGNVGRTSSNDRRVSASCEVQLLPPSPPNRISDFWQACDCLLLPSVYEGLNLQMLEAMANGCVPIVSAIASGPADFVRHGESGMTFPVGDCKQAAECIAELDRDRARLRCISTEARATIAKQCDSAKTTARIVALLDDVIDAPPRPWLRTQAISMRGAKGGESAETADAIRRMEAALTRAVDRGHTAVAIYGAGRFSQSLAAAFAKSPVPIRAFVDDDSKQHGRRLWNWPIVSRETALSLDIDAIIVSSRMNEAQMLHQRAQFAKAGIELVTLYSNAPWSNEAGNGGKRERLQPGRQTLGAGIDRIVAGAVGP